MEKYIKELPNTELFKGIKADDIVPMLSCLGYHTKSYKKGDYIFVEDDNVKNIGIILKGSVNMLKEDFWGNKTTLLRMNQYDMFGETFSCSSDTISSVSFYAASDTDVIFFPFHRVMHSCSMACSFHHRLVENMVFIIAEKNKSLLNKLEIISKKTLREKILAYLSLQAQLSDKEYFEIQLSRTELADYLCADRSALTRELSNMKSKGILDYDKNVFRLT